MDGEKTRPISLRVKEEKIMGKKSPGGVLHCLEPWRGGTWEHHEVGVIDRDFVKIYKKLD